MFHPLYSEEGITWVYITNAGCNPSWINRQPIFIHINDSLLSIEEAIRLEYITTSDLDNALLLAVYQKSNRSEWIEN